MAATVNNDFDRLWLAVKQVSGDNARSLSTSALEPEGVAPLPFAADRMLKLLAFDAGGDPIPSTLTLEQIEQQPALALESAAAAAASAAAAEAAAAMVSGTGALTLPAGTTAQRPGAPTAGMVRRNNTTGLLEGYGSAWGALFTGENTKLAYGVAASAWSAPTVSLDLSLASIASISGINSLFAYNLYFDGTNWRTKATGASSLIVLSGDNVAIQNAPSVTAGSVATLTSCLAVNSSNQVLAVAPAGMGYGAGAGGTVTQITSKATTVTLNKPCGQITMHGASLAANTTVNFTFNNSLLASTDMVMVSPNWGANPGAYQAWCTSTGAGACIISVRNMTAGSLSDALVLNFAILKGVTA